MKTRFLTIALACIVIGAGTAANAATVYDCGFEAPEFALGGLSGQGTPAWSGYYSSGYDAAGSVSNAQAFTGSQSAYTTGYSTSRVTLASVTRAPWLEFAFRTNFAGGGDQVPDAQVWMRSTRGSVSDVLGVNMWIIKQDAQIMLYTTAGSVSLGAAPDQTWTTVSFKHHTYVWEGNTYYSGTADAYVNGVLKGTYALADSSYNGLGTIVFSSNSPSWTKNGAWYVDNIHVGDDSIFVPVPEPSSILALGMGIFGVAGAAFRKIKAS